MLVGLLGLAGVAVLLASASKGNPASASESTEPKNPNLVPDPAAGGRKMLPPSNARSIGTSQVVDPRYDAKGGISLLANQRHAGERLAGTYGGPATPMTDVRPSRPVSVMPTVRTPTSLPSRFRVPLMANATAVKTPTDSEGR